MTARTFLIVGATGQQGGSVLHSFSKLIPSSTSTQAAPRILALTRSAASSKAKELISKYPKLDLTLVEGDVTIPNPIFKSYPNITSIFSYTFPPKEESQAIPLIDAAASAGVNHVVFSSVERGGDQHSWNNPTNVPHFSQKNNVELHLREKAKQSNGALKWTILRPTAFFDNLNPTSMFGPVFASLWATMPAATKLQLVSVHDIGLFGARALLDPEKWSGRAVGLAGQEMTLDQAREVFRRVAGREMPESYLMIAKGIRLLVPEMQKMFDFFEKEGYKADIEAVRRDEPALQDFEKWLRESSKFEFQDKA